MQSSEAKVGIVALSSEQQHLVEVTLRGILESAYFSKSKRYPALLEFAVRHTLEGNHDRLKERIVGMEVFGRPADYDPSTDSVVRIAAGEVRKRMALYFSEHPDTPVRIELPFGSYTAEFHFRPQPPIDTVTPVPSEPASSDKGRSGFRLGRLGVVVPAVVAGVVLVALAAWWLRPASPVERFWAPLLKRNQAVTICLGAPFANDTSQINSAFPKNAIVNTMHQLPNSPVPDITGANSINQFLAGKGAKPEIRMANSVQFSDLHRAPSVLVGATEMNPWIPQLGTDLRYIFHETEQGGLHWIVDTRAPGLQGWKVDVRLPADQIRNDYALITRNLSPATGQWWIGIGGTTAISIAEAQHMVLDPSAMKEIEAQLPRGWESKNIQIVLELTLVNGSVGGVHVVASAVW